MKVLLVLLVLAISLDAIRSCTMQPPLAVERAPADAPGRVILVCPTDDLHDCCYWRRP